LNAMGGRFGLNIGWGGKQKIRLGHQKKKGGTVAGFGRQKNKRTEKTV